MASSSAGAKSASGTFPPLYKRQGKRVRVWQVYIEENDKGHALVKVSHGLKDGKMQTKTISLITQGKNLGRANETSIMEQAILEARSKHDLQARLGYSQNEDEIDTVRVFPMLAYDYRAHSNKVIFPAYIQQKLDGVRCLVHYDPEKKTLTLSTRTMEPITSMLYIEKDLKTYFSKFLGKKGTIYLDGEIYHHGTPLQIITGLVNSETLSPKDEKSLSLLSYHIFDYFDVDNLRASFKTRYDTLTQYFHAFPIPPPPATHISLLPIFPVSSPKEILALNEKFFNEGYEGIMVRNDAPYKLSSGKSGRSHDLLKYKTYEVEEFLIIRIDEAPNKPGTPIFIVHTDDAPPKEFAVASSGTHEYQKEVYKARKTLIGKKIRLKYFGFTEEGIPKFAQTVLGPDDKVILI